MNIDLRNISSEFENEVNKIKREFDINTNSKAVENAVVNYLKNLEDIKKLKEELSQVKHNLYHYERRLDNLKDLFSWIMQE
ncbi:MAG: hypothetical protein REI96_18590 [Flavobacterium nitrogenifigens]|uniref:hypothetical protein n=1 Tax=Flavobacterium nitrogenifigens TaxID=1617283 RepID=UPI0028078ECD|nr:hypothetical protein [Flavobacterium nitrogenifigens]MDQ8014463.1 hypothetical protein [Flavobacterium nitrogenifigens]